MVHGGFGLRPASSSPDGAKAEEQHTEEEGGLSSKAGQKRTPPSNLQTGPSNKSITHTRTRVRQRPGGTRGTTFAGGGAAMHPPTGPACSTSIRPEAYPYPLP